MVLQEPGKIIRFQLLLELSVVLPLAMFYCYFLVQLCVYATKGPIFLTQINFKMLLMEYMLIHHMRVFSYLVSGLPDLVLKRFYQTKQVIDLFIDLIKSNFNFRQNSQ